MELKEISDKVYYSMGDYHQITIDFSQEAESIVRHAMEVRNNPHSALEDFFESKTEVCAKSYEISNTIEIINPFMIKDIEILSSLLELLKTEEDMLKKEIQKRTPIFD